MSSTYAISSRTEVAKAETLLVANKDTLPSAGWSHLCPCVAMSRARRTGTGEPPSVTLSTSMDFLSGLRLPWRLSMGESTRFLGGSADGWQGSEVNEWPSAIVRGFAVGRDFWKAELKTLYLPISLRGGKF